MKIVALGDNLIYGFGIPLKNSWVELRKCQWIHPYACDRAFYNLSNRGDRVSQVSRRLEQEFHHQPQHYLPDLMILSVGMNDSPRVGHRNGQTLTPFAVFQQQLASLLDRAKQLCPIIFVGMTPVDEGKMPYLDCLYYNHADQYRYKEATKNACQVCQIPYIDLFDLWIKQGKSWIESRLSSDGFHLNAKGYEALLEDVFAMKPIDRVSSPDKSGVLLPH
jgi:lysophospholipase L1-like esterase